MEYLDLVEEMEWEDSDKIEWLTLEQAGLESFDIDSVPAIQAIYYREEN